MRKTIEALIYKSKASEHPDTAGWLGSVDFGYQKFLVTADVEILSATNAEMRLTLHRQLNGILLEQKTVLTVPQTRKTEDDPALSGKVEINEDIWACGAWMHSTGDGKKAFRLKFVQMNQREIEDLPCIRPRRPIVTLTPPRWPR